MRILRGVLGAVVWIVASVIGLVAVILCVTVILLPLGIPLLLLSRRLFGASASLILPRQVRHPIQEADKSVRKKGRKGRKRFKKIEKSAPGFDLRKAKKQSRKFLSRHRKRFA